MAVMAVLISANLASCSKEDGSNGGYGEPKLAKMVMGDEDYVVTYSFTYDNQGRVTKVRVGDEEWAWSHIFTWSNNTVKVMEDRDHRCTYTIENGLVQSEYHPGDNYEPSYTQYYTYNLADRLIHDYGKYDSKYVWEDDKLISIVGSGDFDVTYTYEDVACEKGHYPLCSHDPIHMAHPELFGLTMTQLPVSSVNVFRGNVPANDYTETYEYEFNSAGYISKIIVHKVSGHGAGSTYSISLTWK